MAIIYIHGFGSSGMSDTAKMLREVYPSLTAPTYDASRPSESLDSLIRLIDSIDDEDIIIVASSLGGWYAEEIAKRRVVDLVLFNPAITPSTTLAKLGVPPKVLDDYDRISTLKEPSNSARRYVVLSTDDILIDYTLSKAKYEGRASVEYVTGGHRMTAKHIPTLVTRIDYLRYSF